MSAEELVHILEGHGIKATANRILVARALDESDRPLSLMELEEQIGSIDKSGIFRCLALFKEKHLVHSIEGSPEGTRYEICRSHDEEHDDDTHVHFFCEVCHKTFCLEGTPVPPVSLPDGFNGQTVNYLVKGTCPTCSGKD